MPTDRPDQHDRELSKRLRAIEPPESPRHLDETILRHARRKAEEQQWQSKTVAARWFGLGWRSAIAIFSISAIAISVTLQVFDDTQPTDLAAARQQAAADAATAPSPVDRDDQAEEVAVEEVVVTGNSLRSSAPLAAQSVMESTGDTSNNRLLLLLATVLLEDWQDREDDPEALNAVAENFDEIRNTVLAEYAELNAPPDNLNELQQRYREARDELGISTASESLEQAINRIR